jgi:hypothetical protein
MSRRMSSPTPTKAKLIKSVRTFDNGVDDFRITTIDDEISSPDYFWVICRNFEPLTVGGCQEKVKKDDQVLFAYIVATLGVTTQFLKLSGPNVATVGETIVITVTDGGEPGAAIPNAFVESNGVGVGSTGTNGQMNIKFLVAGTQKFKAMKERGQTTTFVRSNQHVIDVFPA